MDDAALADQLAARTLELVDIPSGSRSEGALADHVRGLVACRDLGDDCLLAGDESARVLLAGHLDTVPAQGNLPGRRDGDAVHGLGASDMKAGLAVAIELVLAGAPVAALFFPREELPFEDTALTPLLERQPSLREFEIAIVMEPTDCEVHAGCLGNLNARWTFTGTSGHSARPWLADNAIDKAAAGIAALPGPRPVDFDGLEFVEVATVTRIAGGVAMNVVPDHVEAWLNFRYAAGTDGPTRLAEICEGHGALEIVGHAPAGAVCTDHPQVQRLIETGSLAVAPKQAWTPVAELTAAGVPAVNFGPGVPAQAHTRTEQVPIANLVRAYRVLEAWLG
jgi:succinyl-diaminopimelate desuccinylase